MRLLAQTLKTPGENLALDEVLLEWADQTPKDQSPANGAPAAREALRLWEAPGEMVVLGRSSKIEQEVDVAICRGEGIPMLRRSSGGATILAGPGCLMYAVTLTYDHYPHLRDIEQAHKFVLGRIAEALGGADEGVARRGTSDLAVGDFKFSGNSLRCKRNALLYHGTILYDFPLERLDTLLGYATREPEYRQQRTHGKFVRNLEMPREEIERRLVDAFGAEEPLTNWLEQDCTQQRLAELTRDKYNQPEWTWER